jgi:hypothetical protein
LGLSLLKSAHQLLNKFESKLFFKKTFFQKESGASTEITGQADCLVVNIHTNNDFDKSSPLPGSKYK